MRRLFLLAVPVFALVSLTCYAQMTLGDGATVVFATAAQGKAILGNRDDFVARTSPFDRAARLKTDKDISEKDFLEFVGKNTLEWTDAEKRKILSAIEGLQTELKALSLPFPNKVFMIKTTGNEEGNAAYTRTNAIVLPKAELGAPAAKIQKLICHELFHIVSRANPVLREQLYAAIGFVKCDEADFPAELLSRKITNPDAPRNDHCIRVQVEGKERWAIPILYSGAERYSVQRGGEFFDYLQFKFLLVERNEGSPTARPVYDGQNAKLVGAEQVSGFIEQIGKNTQYIIHPEEILADNFALLVLQAHAVPSPEIIAKMKAIFLLYVDVQLTKRPARGCGWIEHWKPGSASQAIQPTS